MKGGPPYKYLVLPGNESVLVTDSLGRRPWWQAVAGEADRWSFWWGGNGQKFDFKTFAGTAKSCQLVNRLPKHSELCTKSGLAANLARLQQLNPETAHWIPESYVLPSKGTDKAAYQKFKDAYYRHANGGGGTTWILKPTSMNRGNGIEVFNTLEHILAHLNSRPSGTNWVVQKYIDYPLLVGGRKFDIRAYVLVAPGNKVYLHKEAYIRTSATLFKLDDLSDKSAHLTNDAVQKVLPGYNSFEDHCKLSMAELQDALGPAAPDMATVYWPAAKAAVASLFGLACPKMNPAGTQHCFELLGLDFMMDEAGQLFLIEVNTCPALFRAGKVLTDLLPRVVEEVVQKVVDPIFPPPPGCEIQEQLDGFQPIELVQLHRQRSFQQNSSIGQRQ